MKIEQRQLVWRFVCTAAAIAITVSVAVIVARWTGPLS
jgi:hypothetical protein